MMTRLLTSLAMVCVVASSSMAAQPLEFDKEASKITFVGTKTDGKHEGGFEQIEAKATADFEDPSQGSLEITIYTTSLWSDDTKLTNHLKNPDFFDVRKYPTITFKATKIEAGEEAGKATISGVITMLGNGVNVDIPANAEVTDQTITVKADFKIDRTKWGMTYGEGKIDNDVAIKANLVFKR